MWSRHYRQCVCCEQTKFKHMAKGVCSSCYAKNYRSDPVRKARIDQQKIDWYWRYHAENLLKRKITREQVHHSGQRAVVLERDNYQCVRCGTEEQLVIHHKDRQGRGHQKPNNDLDNLETLCRGCHMLEHSDEVQAGRKKYKI